MYEKYTETDAQEKSLVQPTMEILINENNVLLRESLSLYLINRVMLSVLVLYQLIMQLEFGWQHLAIATVGSVLAIFWYVREIWIDRQLKRIGEIIAQTDLDDRWRDTLIRWHHEKWQYSRFKNLLGLEPFFWLTIILAITVLSISSL